MSSRKNAIRRQFNRSAAGSYDRHAHVQRIMADNLAKKLLKAMDHGETTKLNIVEIGCGTGTLTEMLVNDWPGASITALDIAPAMIEVAEQRVKASNECGSSSSRVRFLLADVEKWASDASAESFDIIVANACFQWLSRPSETLGKLRRLLRAEGLLVFTTFGPDTFRELHEAFNAVYRASGIEPQRHGLSFQSSGEWQSLLQEAGFSTIQFENSIQTEKYATARDFLHSVKAVGASTSEAAVLRGLSTRQLFAGMYKEYENKFSIPGGVAATYDLLFIQAGVSRKNV
ncbi:malonyl-ACP O-methyltransferase BioC [Paenibacillus sp. Soil522]|uniref:malonyl-ACP O-methyltransferase BioC n=1 Tax=Paenibacillus sp. Soil522 TaxID=1736388 RepID=UPI0006F5B3E2|nr:malonyl-ACP O-methyltransferase BioC [Paenibacillus sp. Soil522]KRE49652.1 malonyl-[acyl-carrier protein] O-methyltransferase BioC [Paenibacillus sp. Soil522]